MITKNKFLKMSQKGIKKHGHLMKQLYNHKTPRDAEQLYALQFIEKQVVKAGRNKFKIHFCKNGRHGFKFDTKPNGDVADFLKAEGYIVGELKEVESNNIDVELSEGGRPMLKEVETKCWELDVELPK